MQEKQDKLVNDAILSLKGHRAVLDYLKTNFVDSSAPTIPKGEILNAGIADRYYQEKSNRMSLKKEMEEALKVEDDLEATLINVFREIGCRRIDAYREGFDNPVCAQISERGRKDPKKFYGLEVVQSDLTKEFEINIL